jgi:glycosyltransferase involved in cell wall biosynthesis
MNNWLPKKLDSLHICFVCNEIPPAPAGGIGPNVLTNAEHLVRAGHRVTLIGNYEKNYSWNFADIRMVPLPLKSSNLSFSRRIYRTVIERLQIRSAIARINAEDSIDIVEWPDFMGLYLKKLPGIVDVLRNHGPLMSHCLIGVSGCSWHVRWLELHTLRAIPNWVGVSEWFMNEWLRISKANPRNRTVLYNTVDCDLFHPSEQSLDNLILYCGALSERKGVFMLARAAALFLKQLPNARLLFIGREVDFARKKILELAGPEVVEQIEFREPMSQAEVASIMRTATVFAMPSILESFGNVWAEAMASGIPVVASKLSCGPEVVPDGVAGILIDPYSPEDIASAIVKLMQDCLLRQRLGRQGREIAFERYSTCNVIPRTIEFYKKCIKSAYKNTGE